MSLKNIRAVIFDADGMVIKGERVSVRLSRDFNVPMEKINKFFDNEFKDCILGKRDLKEAVMPYLSIWGWKGSIDDFLHFWFSESYHNDEEVINIIKKLKSLGISCILATSQEKYRVSFMRKEMGLEKIFDNIISTAETGYKKMSDEFFGKIMKLLPGIKKGEVLFCDDRENNVKTASDFGFSGYLYREVSDFRNRLGL